MNSFSYPLANHDFAIVVRAGVSADNDSLYIQHNDQVLYQSKQSIPNNFIFIFFIAIKFIKLLQREGLKNKT